MSDEKTITVAELSDGPGGYGDPGTEVSLPVVELLTGRGFVTGKSGSGKSNTASVIAEKLLDNGFGLLIVDIDGEYYGLKEEYEILHAGGDEECDIQVTADHAEKLATLALEQNVPIILDVSSYLDEQEAQDLLTAVAQQLFVKAKKLKQPFLLLVEEIHEYIPEKGGIGECGRMLIKIGKRGRKHGLGITGISQRPADVKKDFITQCDWLVWHRLTWNNDTKVVGRILDSEYEGAVEDLNDGEAFMMTDWSDHVRRAQFHRKQTFDAGATPGLDDFERPDLKSVSDDLVSELESISDAEQERDDTIAELREELDKKNSRIAELEKELQDARDLSRMADQFVDAMLDQADGASPGRTETERMRARRARREGMAPVAEDGTEALSDPHAANGNGQSANGQHANGSSPNGQHDNGHAANGQFANGNSTNGTQASDSEDDSTETTSPSKEDMAAAFGAFDDDGDADESENSDAAEDSPEQASADDMAAAFGAFDNAGGEDDGETETANAAADEESESADTTDDEQDEDTPSFPSFDEPVDAPTLGNDGGGESDDASTDDAAGTMAFSDADAPEFGFETPDSMVEDEEPTDSDDATIAAAVEAVDGRPAVEPTRPEPPSVGDIRATIRNLDEKSRRMLAYYHKEGPASPLDAHFVAGGTGDRTDAYSHNRKLRLAGLIEHVGRGKYDTSLEDRLDDATGGRLEGRDRQAFLGRLESLLEMPA